MRFGLFIFFIEESPSGDSESDDGKDEGDNLKNCIKFHFTDADGKPKCDIESNQG